MRLSLIGATGAMVYAIAILAEIGRAADDFTRTVIDNGYGAVAPDGSPFWAIGMPSIDALGRAAFRTRNERRVDAAYREDGQGKFLEVIREGNEAPGSDPDYVFSRFINLQTSGLGHSAIVASLVHRDSFPEPPIIFPPYLGDQVGIWAHNGESLRLVARTGQQAPGVEAGVVFQPLMTDYEYESGKRKYTMNDLGHVAFQAHLTGPGTSDPNDRGIFVESASGLQLVARRGMPTPGLPGAVFALFSPYDVLPPVVNDRGQVAFLAGITGDVTGRSMGIWRGDAPERLQLLVSTGVEMAALGTGVSLARLWDPRLNNSGKVAFQAVLSGPMVDAANDTAICTADEHGLELIAREGHPAPGAGSATYDARLHMFWLNPPLSPIINDQGAVLFISGLTGPDITESNDSGMWLRDPQGKVTLIAREGDPTGEGGFFGDFNYDSTQYALNSRGQIAFQNYQTVPTDTTHYELTALWATDLSGRLKSIAKVRLDRDSWGQPLLVHSSGNGDGYSSILNDRGEIVFARLRNGGIQGIYVSHRVVPEPSAALLLTLSAVTVISRQLSTQRRQRYAAR